MLGLLMKKISVSAPFDGTTMDITEVNDAVFAQLMMGDGCAVMPVYGEVHASVEAHAPVEVHAPVAGRIELIAETKHAICIKTPEGLEIMLHCGIDTVKFGGEGFEILVEAGQQVRAGDLLCRCDMEYFQSNAVDLTSPILVLNSDQYAIVKKQLGKRVAAGDEIFTVVKK